MAEWFLACKENDRKEIEAEVRASTMSHPHPIPVFLPCTITTSLCATSAVWTVISIGTRFHWLTVTLLPLPRTSSGAHILGEGVCMCVWWGVWVWMMVIILEQKYTIDKPSTGNAQDKYIYTQIRWLGVGGKGRV